MFRRLAAFPLRVAILIAVSAAVAVAFAGSSGAWTTNLVTLDDGTCGTNLQIGSDKTASSSAAPSFVGFGDGPSGNYQAFVDGTSIGTFHANSHSYVCIYAPTLSQGAHVLTGNELAPNTSLTLTPLNFSVDSVPPAAPSTPSMNPFFDTGSSTTDGITKYRSLGFAGTADPNTSVQAYNGFSGLGGTKSDSTGAWSLATPTLTDGNYLVTANGIDSAGNKSASSPGTAITVDGTAPSSTLTNPLTGQVVTGSIPVQANASDNLGVWKVDFQVDGVTKQTVTTGGSPYSWTWNSASASNGSHTLTALVTDVAGNTGSSAVTVTVSNGSATVPGAPSLDSATASTGSVALAWSAPSSNGGSAVAGYKLYRGTTIGGETLLTTLGNVTSYTDGAVSNGTTYYYKLTAVNSIGEGAFSNERSATPQAAATAPFPVTVSSASPGNGSVSVVWSAPGSDGGSPITGYKVYRGTSSGNETFLATVATVTSYIDTSVTAGTTYYYKVSALNSIGESSLSNELSATPTGIPGAPLLTSATAANGAVSLAWSAPASTGGLPLGGYKLYRGTTSGGETFVAALGNVTTYTDSGLTNGATYYYKLSATNSAGEGPLSNERSASPTTTPTAPTLNSASAGSGAVTLSWSAPSSDGGSPVSSYTVYRSTTSGGETLLAGGLTSTSYTDTGAANGTTYYYQVTATNSTGESVRSNERSATPATVPGPPTLSTPAAGSGSVTLAWSAPASNGGSTVTGYKVYRGTSSGGESLISTLGNVTSFTDGALANGTTYYYKVSAVNAVGEGALSSERSATPATVPGAATLTSATAGNATVALAWSAPTSDGGSALTGYRIYRGTSTGTETLLASVGTATTWTDSTAANGTTYFYKVSAINAVGEGTLSNERSATPVTVPGAPTLNQAVAGASKVTLSWSAPASNGGSAVTGYRIYRGASSGGEVLLTTVGTATSWTDNGVTNGTTYFYKVSAISAVGESAPSSERSATPATVPGPPTLATAAAGNGSVTLTWTPPLSDGGSAVTGYKIYRGTSSGSETLIWTLGSVASFTDTSLTNGTTYYYVVTAVNGLGEGTFSNERSAVPVTVPGAPTLGAASAGDSSVSLSWSAPASSGGSAVTGYRVYRSTASGTETLLTTLGNVTSWTDSALTNGTTYFYKVSALNAVGEGVQSGEQSATPRSSATVPGAVALTSATAGNSKVSLAWSAPTSDGGSALTGYRIYRGTTSGGETLLTTIGTATTWNDSGVANGTTYFYKVSAVNAVGEGSLSGERSATPATVPGAPTLGTPVAGDSTVALSWSAPASNGGSTVTGYKLYRGTTSGGEALIATLGATTSFNDSGLANGTTYYYTLTAVNALGEGSASAERSATPARPVTAPGAPALSPATAGTGSVRLDWTAPASDGGSAIYGYRVYRSTISGGETLLVSLGTATTYTDTAVANGTTYYYVVSALNGVGESLPSTERSATPVAPATAPGAPNLLSATAADGSVALSWTAPSDGGSPINSYRVYRGTAAGAEALVATLGTATTFTDGGLSNGTTYYYKVTAVNGVGEGFRSNELSATPVAPATRPGAPSLDWATPATTVSLGWSAPPSDGGSPITGYNVYRGTSSGGETLLVRLGTATTYVDTAVAGGTTYYYTVTAVTAVGESALSNELSAKPIMPDTTAPSKPASVKVLVTGTSQAALNWSAATDDVGVTGYQVYREGKLVATVSTTYYLDGGMSAGSSHSYTVRARDAAGNVSLASSSVSAKLPSVSGSTGTLSGVVYNTAGKVLSGAVVSLRLSSGTTKTAKTSSSGVWKLSSLPPGAYTLTVTFSGYRTYSFGMTAVRGQNLLALPILSQ